MITNSLEMLQDARDKGYAVASFNTNNLEWTKAILLTAQAANSPVMIQVTAGAAKYMGNLKTAYHLIVDLHEALNITVPVAIHLDHGNYEDAKLAIELGFTSVMFDGSHFPIEENLAKTHEIVELAHAKGVTVEAEVGTIGGEEDGLVAVGEIAPVEDAVALINTGVDILAAGIGNVHGPYPANWKSLDFAHLADIQQAVDEATGRAVPLVLHGGSGIPDEQIQRAISLGVAKINVNTEGQLAFHKAVRDFVLSGEDLRGKNYDPRKFLAPGTNAIITAFTTRIDVFGSTGRAY
ncbi:MAG TPA: class II fructose-1,6-bisphosphate aldolase [Lactobacillaceae bacterium]|jgi:fructose-bisphosphate aldolase class II